MGTTLREIVGESHEQSTARDDGVSSYATGNDEGLIPAFEQIVSFGNGLGEKLASILSYGGRGTQADSSPEQ